MLSTVQKTRLSREFKRLIAPKNTETEELEDAKAKYFTTMLLRKICSLGQRPECRHQPKTKKYNQTVSQIGYFVIKGRKTI